MHVKLSDIVFMRSGIYGKVMPLGQGSIRYIQVVDFKEGFLSPLSSSSAMIKDVGKDTKHFLKENDILFVAKGTYNYATVYHLPKEYYPAVASSSFLVLQIQERDAVLPDYLCWYLNHPQTMKILKLNSKGTSIPSISKANIQNMKIHLPSLKHQQLIVKIDGLLERERILQKNIYDLNKELLIKSIQ